MPVGLGRARHFALAAMALALVPLYALLHALVAPALPRAADPLTLAAGLLGAALLAALVGLALAVMLRPRHPVVARWRIHFRQGLYAHLPLERSVDRLMRQRQPESTRLDPVTTTGEAS